MIYEGDAKANNKKLKSHEHNKPKSYVLIYLDANNLYRQFMM